jgi:hypothetical protein
VRWLTWLYMYNQLDLSLVSCAGGFLWVTVSHLSSLFAFSACLELCSMVFSAAGWAPSCFCLMICFTRSLAYAGCVNATCLPSMSSSVSISSSMVASGGLDTKRVVFRTCTVGAMSPFYCTLSTYSCLRKWAHFVTPSISSRLLNRFLKPSTDKNKECTDGVLSVYSPVRLVLCFAPIAACSYFSIAWI